MKNLRIPKIPSMFSLGCKIVRPKFGILNAFGALVAGSIAILFLWEGVYIMLYL